MERYNGQHPQCAGAAGQGFPGADNRLPDAYLRRHAGRNAVPVSDAVRVTVSVPNRIALALSAAVAVCGAKRVSHADTAYIDADPDNADRATDPDADPDADPAAGER
jgi:hypothetical protein